jgi:hypothetical protein
MAQDREPAAGSFEDGCKLIWVPKFQLVNLQMSFDPRQKQRIFPVASVSRPALRPTQPPVQWVPGVLSPGVKRGLT